jgi:CBS domain-containing protein
MTSRLIVSRPSTFLKDAARVLMTEKISSLPVIDAELQPVGLVTMADVLGYLVNHPAMELWS